VKRLLPVVLFALIACGKRGDPHAPVPVIPQPTSDLVVTQRAAKVLLTWSYPSLTTSGRSLASVRRIVIYRYDEQLPPSATIARDTTPREPSIPDAVSEFAKVPTLTAAQFAKLSQKVDSIEGANLATATVGSKLVYGDTPPFRSSSGRPVRLTYAIVTEGLTARGDYSNLATIVPLPVALPPGGPTATAETDHVVLKWAAPTKAATGDDKPVIVGYDIYRDADDIEKPINPTPVQGTSFNDTPSYGDHTYRVTAVASAGPPKIQSDPSAPASVTFKDLVPPPPPASVTVLVETRVVRLIWDPVQAADLEGYNVYRTEGTIRIKLTPGPTHDPNFEDVSVDIGIPYFYSVTSVDKNKNESAPTNSEPIVVPKTP
jgi:hypothetical protein